VSSEDISSIGGVTLFLVELRRDVERWRILRRLASFKTVSEHLVKDGVHLDYPIIEHAGLHHADSDYHSKEKASKIQAFLTEILTKDLHLKFEYAAALLTPIRVLVQLEVDCKAPFGLKAETHRLLFIDPFDDGESVHPVVGTPGHKGWESVPLSHLKLVSEHKPSAVASPTMPRLQGESIEKVTLRAISTSMASHKHGTDAEKLALGGAQRRLRDLASHDVEALASSSEEEKK